MKYVWLDAAYTFELHRVLQARHAAPVRVAENLYSRNLVHADAPVAHAPALVHLEHLLVDLDVVPQVSAVADLAEQRDFLVAAHARQVIALVGEGPDEIRFRRFAQRRFCRELLPRPASVARDELAFAVGFLVESDRIGETHPVEKILVEVLVKPLHIDTDIAEQGPGFVGVTGWRVNRLGTAVGDLGPATDRELVSLGVAAEVIVIVENENARRRVLAAIEIRS